MENKLVISQLEEFLRKIQTDLYFFDDYKKKSSNELLNYSISEMEKDFKAQLMTLSSQVNKLGGTWSNSINFYMENPTNFSPEMSNLGLSYNDNILTEAYNLANEGIMMGNRLIQENPNLDHDSYRMVTLILKTYQKHMYTLMRYSY
ncbi:hypothetical protein [Clostridium sp.]|uniref:hypothetical protein n=1 Tax=Clostridium sp. TaxID=1506 RepID=UPI002FCB2738